MYKIISVYILILTGIFVQFGFLGAVGSFVLKIIILAAITYLLYDLWQYNGQQKQQPEQDQKDAEREESTVFEMSTLPLGRLLSADTTVHDFLKDQFGLMWDILLPKNGYLFLSDSKQQVQLLHRRNIIEPQHLPVGKDWGLFKLIQAGDGILLESNFEAAAHVLPFYGGLDYTPRSLLGLETELVTGEKLFWVFDGDLPDFFNQEDLPLLTKIRQNARIILHAVLQNETLAEAHAMIYHQLELGRRLIIEDDFEHAVDVFTEFLTNEFEASRLTIAFREGDDMSGTSAVIHTAIGTEDGFGNGYTFDLEEGLNGFVISKNKPYLIEDMDKGDYFIPRFSRSEKTNFGLRSFLSVPLQTDDRSMGMVTLEDKSAAKYDIEDKKRLTEYATLFALTLTRILNKNEKE